VRLFGGGLIVLVLVAGLCIGALGIGMRQKRALSLSAALFVVAVLLTRLFFPDALFHPLKDFARWMFNIPAG